MVDEGVMKAGKIEKKTADTVSMDDRTIAKISGRSNLKRQLFRHHQCYLIIYICTNTHTKYLNGCPVPYSSSFSRDVVMWWSTPAHRSTFINIFKLVLYPISHLGTPFLILVHNSFKNSANLSNWQRNRLRG